MDRGTADRDLRPIELPDAELEYWPALLDPPECESLLASLLAHTPWRSEHVSLWGRRYAQPRLIAWYGDPGAVYTYSRTRWEPLPWTDLLRALKERVERAAGAPFNSALLNYYRDERDSMGMHSDDEPELGPRPCIGSLTLGAVRPLVLKHRSRAELGRVRLELACGSLLVMKGETQRHWKHGIEKSRRPCGPRLNLTFRSILAREDAGTAYRCR